MLENLYKKRIRESDQFKTVLKLYKVGTHQKMSKPDHQRLNMLEKRSMEQKIKTRDFQPRNERNGIGAVTENRREKSGGE